MNLRTVLRTYGLLRQLTDDETALLNTLRGMNDGERELLVESLSPEKIKRRKPNSKQRSDVRCIASLISAAGTPYICKERKDHLVHDPYGQQVGFHQFEPPQRGSKSPRAASLATAIQGTAKPQPASGPLCAICAHEEDYEDHAQPSPHYHPFAPPAPTAGKQSSRNGVARQSAAGSEIEKVAAGVAVHAVSGGGSGE